MRKNEVETTRLKEHLKKSMGESCLPMANSFTITETLISKGIHHAEFDNHNVKVQQVKLESALEENTEMRETLEGIMHHLRDILQKKIESAEASNIASKFEDDFI